MHLSILDHGDVVYIDKIDSDHPVRAYSRIGGRAPAHCVATGKALLAFAPAEVADAVIADSRKFTSRTITDREALKREFDRVRRNGIAVNIGEWREAVCGLAAPILDSAGNVIAAVGISGPAERLSSRAIKAYAPMVRSTAQSISETLGFLGQPATGQC